MDEIVLRDGWAGTLTIKPVSRTVCEFIVSQPGAAPTSTFGHGERACLAAASRLVARHYGHRVVFVRTGFRFSLERRLALLLGGVRA